MREEGPTARLKKSQFSIQGPSQQLGETGGEKWKSHISTQELLHMIAWLLSDFEALVA